MKTKHEILEIINNSTGTTQYHKFSLFPNFPVVTDGVIEVTKAADCFWLLDMIGGSQKIRNLIRIFKYGS